MSGVIGALERRFFFGEPLLWARDGPLEVAEGILEPFEPEAFVLGKALVRLSVLATEVE